MAIILHIQAGKGHLTCRHMYSCFCTVNMCDEKLGCCYNIIRILLFLFNFTFWVRLMCTMISIIVGVISCNLFQLCGALIIAFGAKTYVSVCLYVYAVIAGHASFPKGECFARLNPGYTITSCSLCRFSSGQLHRLILMINMAGRFQYQY